MSTQQEQQTQRIDWPGGYAIIGGPPGVSRDVRRQRTTAAETILSITGRRRDNGPEAPSTRYQDPTRERTIDQVRGELARRKTDRDYSAHQGQPIFTGWVITQTDGYYAICTPGEPGKEFEDRAPTFRGEIAQIGILPAEAWRAYAPVRPLRNPKTHTIRWIMGPKGYAWYVNHPELGEARGMYQVWGADGAMRTDELSTILLSDRYLWPCRGMRYHVGITVHPYSQIPAIVLEPAWGFPLCRIVIMGFDEGKRGRP